MNAYTYHWSLRPRAGICVELRIEARDAITARREVAAFLHQHDAGGWPIEAVSRTQCAPAAGRVVEALPSGH